MNKTQRTGLAWLWLSVLVILIDQLTKYWVLGHLQFAQPVQIFPFMDLTLLYNKGMAFSLLANHSGWQVGFLGGLAGVISIALLVWLYRTPAKQGWTCFALALVLGGALGNLIDRVHHGFVVDFLDFHYKGWHYPAFNVADIALCIGAGMLVLELLFRGKS